MVDAPPADLRIFSYLPNPRLSKATIAARFSGARIDIVGDKPRAMIDWLWDFEARHLSDEDKQSLSGFARVGTIGFAGGTLYKSDAFLKAHPFGSIPAAFSGDGSVGIFESNAIMRAAARLGPNAHTLLGRGPMHQSRVDSFLDRSLVFARDSQRYLLTNGTLCEQDYAEMATSLETYAAGIDNALQYGAFIAGDDVTLADIAVVCELCLLTNEYRFEDQLSAHGFGPLLPRLAPYTHLGDHMAKLAADARFIEDLDRYLKRLLAVWA